MNKLLYEKTCETFGLITQVTSDFLDVHVTSQGSIQEPFSVFHGMFALTIFQDLRKYVIIIRLIFFS